MDKQKGITLVALVVTIIVLIILAGISVNLILGENGVIKKAQIAREMQANAQEHEKDIMNILDDYISDKIITSNGEVLTLIYTIEDIDEKAKLIKLNYFKENGNLTTQQIEEKLQGLLNITSIPEEFKNEILAFAESNSLSYEDALLECILGGPFEAEEREEIKVQAESYNMTYRQYMEMGLAELGIYFVKGTTQDIEKIYEQSNEIVITQELRNKLKEEAQNNNITYKEYLLEQSFVAKIIGENNIESFREVLKQQIEQTESAPYNTYYEVLESLMLEEYGATLNKEILEVKIDGLTLITTPKLKFVATRNGTYTAIVNTKDGDTGEIQIQIDGLEEEKFSEIYTQTKEYIDVNGEKAIIPKGFAVAISQGIKTIEDGLVITDAVDSNGYSIGNEFVWIPVESDETFIRESFEEDRDLDSMGYQEPYKKGYSDGNGTQELADYTKMREQVLKHNGFYVGRYEAGVNSTALRFFKIPIQEVVIKRGVAPYTDIEWGTSMSEIGNKGIVYVCNNMYKDSQSVTSTLIYGVQWDSVCRYIENCKEYEYNNSLGLTGVASKESSDIHKNIYDLAGNYAEYTMEAQENNDTRIQRGATGDMAGTPSTRDIGGGSYEGEVCFRVALYIK